MSNKNVEIRHERKEHHMNRALNESNNLIKDFNRNLTFFSFTGKPNNKPVNEVLLRMRFNKPLTTLEIYAILIDRLSDIL